MRVHEWAKRHGLDSSAVLEAIERLGLNVKRSASAALDAIEAEALARHFQTVDAEPSEEAEADDADAEEPALEAAAEGGDAGEAEAVPHDVDATNVPLEAGLPTWEVRLKGNPTRRVAAVDRASALAAYYDGLGIVSSVHPPAVTRIER